MAGNEFVFGKQEDLIQYEWFYSSFHKYVPFKFWRHPWGQSERYFHKHDNPLL